MYEAARGLGRLFLDSTAVTTYYLGGHSRRTVTAYAYYGRTGQAVPQAVILPIDTTATRPPILHPDTITTGGTGDNTGRTPQVALLRMVKVACLGQTLTRHYAYSSCLNTGIYPELTDSGYTALPMEERVEVGGEEIGVATEWGCFAAGGLQRVSWRILHRGDTPGLLRLRP